MHPVPRPPLLRRLRPGHWLAFDGLAVLASAFVAMGVMTPHPVRAQVPLALLASVVFSLPVGLRRSHPLAALALPVALLLAVVAVVPRAAVMILMPLALAVYSVAATRRPRTALVALAAAITTVLAVVLPAIRHIGAILAFILLLITVWTVGYAVGLHRRYTEDLLRHQGALADAELAKARQETAEERLLIAREMHDVVAHTMSVINVQAGYGHFVIDDQPAAARDALAAIRTTSRDAIREMRGLLGVLRGDGPDEDHLRPAPGLADLDKLIARIAEAGVHVALRIIGQPRELPPGINLSAYRILQEALTNVVQHAASRTARATLDYREDELSIEVTDDGRGAAAATAHRGHGLAGMRERVHLYGGRFNAAPLPGRGYRVTASLPIGDGTT